MAITDRLTEQECNVVFEWWTSVGFCSMHTRAVIASLVLKRDVSIDAATEASDRLLALMRRKYPTKFPIGPTIGSIERSTEIPQGWKM